MCNGTECEQMFETPNLSKRLRINNACNIGFLGDDPKVAKYNSFCGSESEIDENGVLFNGPEQKPTRRSTKVCRNPLATTEGLGGTCDNLPVFALTYEMNFVYDFEHDSGKRPMMGDDVNEEVARSKFVLIRSDFPKNQDTFHIINEFANNQQIWAEEFLN